MSISPPCLQKCRFIRQKLRTVALQQDQILRCVTSIYSIDMSIFIDETGSDNRNVLLKYGYSLQSKIPVNHALLGRGEQVRAIV